METIFAGKFSEKNMAIRENIIQIVAIKIVITSPKFDILRFPFGSVGH